MPENNQAEKINITVKRPRKKPVKRIKAEEIRAEYKKVSRDVPAEPASERKETIDHKKSKPLNIYRNIALSFIVLTVLLIAGVAYFYFVKVAIIIVPNQETINNNLVLDVRDKDKIPLESSSSIIGVVRQVTVEQTNVYPATGKQILGQEVTGKVTIINNYNKNQPLVATTRLLSPDNKLFRIKDTVNVPAGGQIEVEVYADEAKAANAIGPSRFTIPGLWAGLQDKITGQSNQAMRYEEKVKLTIKQSDIDQAVNDLKQGILAKAKEEIYQAYADYNQILFKLDDNSLSQQLDGKVGEAKDQFSLTMKSMVNLAAFKDDKVYELAKEKLVGNLPDDNELIEFNKQDIGYSLSNINADQGSASLNVSFSGKTSLRQDAPIIDRSKLVGLTGDQLREYLNSLPEIAGYEVKFFPPFIKKAPELADRITVEVKRN